MTLYKLEVGQHWLYTMRMRLSSPNPFAINVADGFGVYTIPYIKLYICIYVLCAFVYIFCDLLYISFYARHIVVEIKTYIYNR